MEYFDSLIKTFPFSSMSCQTSITIKCAYRLVIDHFTRCKHWSRSTSCFSFL